MLKTMRYVKSFTLVEVLIAMLILVVGVTGVYMLYINATYYTHEANRVGIATRELTSVMETLKNMSLSEMKAQKSNTTYWDDTVSDVLPAINVTVTNIDANDTSWNNDPLELNVTLQWSERGHAKVISMMSAFTDN